MKNMIAIFAAALAFASCGAGPTQTSSSAELSSATESARSISLTGKLIRIAAVGGESTGFGLTTEAGIVELDLATRGLSAQFIEGRIANVTGQFETRRGIEIPSRKVFVVATLKLQEANDVVGNTIVVNGDEAAKIMEALAVTELTKHPIEAGYITSLSGLHCQYTPRGFVYAQCSFSDGAAVEPNKDIAVLTDAAMTLQNALIAAGVPAHRSEDSTTFVQAEVKAPAIQCMTGGFVAANHCEIKQ